MFGNSPYGFKNTTENLGYKKIIFKFSNSYVIYNVFKLYT